jgi:predicted DNA-binding transcriptional regulator AlpA
VTEYEFTLKFALPSPDVDIDDCIERLGDCGCEDAVIGIGQRGRIALDFVREADSAEEAVLSGIVDVRRAVPGVELIEASPDLVGLTDVADLLHVSRQYVRKLILDGKAAAPAPVHEGRPTIWRLARVLEWLRQQKGYRVDDALLELARTTLQVNLAVDQRDADASSQSEILALLA